MGGGGGGGGRDWSQEDGGGEKQKCKIHEPSQNSYTQHIVFVTIYISKKKDH